MREDDPIPKRTAPLVVEWTNARGESWTDELPPTLVASSEPTDAEIAMACAGLYRANYSTAAAYDIAVARAVLAMPCVARLRAELDGARAEAAAMKPLAEWLTVKDIEMLQNMKDAGSSMQDVLLAYQRGMLGNPADDPRAEVGPTAAPGQCPACGEYSMSARARQWLFGTTVHLG